MGFLNLVETWWFLWSLHSLLQRVFTKAHDKQSWHLQSYCQTHINVGLVSLTITRVWSLCLVNFNGVVPHGHLDEDVYMPQPLRWMICYLPPMYANSTRQFIVLNRHLRLGIMNYVIFFLALVLSTFNKCFLVHLSLRKCDHISSCVCG